MMDHCGAKNEEQLKKLCFEHLPKNSKAIKTKLANEFLDQLRRLGLIDDKEFDELAGAIYPILLRQ